MSASGDLFFYGGRFGDSLRQRCKLDLARPSSMAELATLAALVGSLVAASVGGVVLRPAGQAPLLSLGAGFLSHKDRHLHGSAWSWRKGAWFRRLGRVGVGWGKDGETFVPDLVVGVSALEPLLAPLDFPFYCEDFPHEAVGLAHGTAIEAVECLEDVCFSSIVVDFSPQPGVS